MYNEALKNLSDIVVCQRKNYDAYTGECSNARGINIGKNTTTTVEPKELAQTLFTTCDPVPWNKLFKRETINQYNLFFQNVIVSNDIYFSLSAMALAKYITYLFKPFVYYRHNRKNNLRNARDKAPTCFYRSYSGVFDILNKHDLYNTFKRTFLNSFMSTAIWTVDNTEEKRDYVKQFIRSEIYPKYVLGNEDILAEGIRKGIIEKGLNRTSELIVSLTSFPARINTVNQTIESLLNQTIKADKVILWLAPEQFPNLEKDLPQQLLDLRNKGLIIDWYHDIRSYKKLIPTLKRYPEAIIITADDDIIYENNTVEKLYKAHLKSPHSVISHRTTRLYYCDGNIKIYPRAYYVGNNHEYIDEFRKPNIFNMQTGCQAVLYPSNCFYKDILDEDLIKKLAPTNDDQWFWAMAALNGYFVEVPEQNNYNIKYVPGTQEGECLWKINDRGEQLYFRDLKRIIAFYPKIKELLDSNNKNNCNLLYNIASHSNITFNKFNENKKQLEEWFYRVTKKNLDLNCPNTYNEKLQWLKLNDRKDIYTTMVDKYEAKKYVADLVCQIGCFLFVVMIKYLLNVK